MTSINSSRFSEPIINELIRNRRYQRHLVHLDARTDENRATYRAPTRSLGIDAFSEEGSGYYSFPRLPAHIDERKLAKDAAEAGICLALGRLFYCGDDPPCPASASTTRAFAASSAMRMAPRHNFLFERSLKVSIVAPTPIGADIAMETQNTRVPNEWDRKGLPAWSFFSTEMLEAEKEQLFRRHWQVVCHVNDVPDAGDFMASDLVGERALVIRGRDMEVRAFHNLCRHRGSRVVAENSGNCKSAIICPFHGWAYNLDGTLRGAAQPQSLPDLDPVEMGLKPIEMEIWQGFVFVRFKPGPQPSVAKIMSRFDKELAQYDLENLVPAEEGFWASEIEANWKCVRDVDNEGYHVAMAHPGLHDLFGTNYHDEPFSNGTSRSLGQFREGKHRLWSVEQYRNILEPPARLDDDHKAAWLYVGMFPNLVFGLYPDSVIFYHEFPVENGKTVQRGSVYRLKDEDRRTRAARYLSMRIDRITSKEDEQLIEWTWEAAFSSGFDGIVLSDLEYGVRSYHDALRKIFPVLDGDEPPKGTLAEVNQQRLSAPAP